MRTKKGFSIPTVLLGLVLLLLSEAARIFHVTGLAGLLVFFLPVIPLYLLLSKALDDGWERFLISSSLYIALMGLLLFIWRLNLFLPISFRALFLLVDFFIIAFSALLSFESAEIKVGLPRKIDYKKNLPIVALLVFAALFYSLAAEYQDSWQKELRNVKWAMTVSLASEGGEVGDILLFSNHQPMHAVLGAVTANLFGFSQYSKTILYSVFAVLELLAILLLSKFMFKENGPGIAAALFLLSSGLFLHHTTTAHYVAPYVFFQIITFYALYRCVSTGKNTFFYSLALFFSVSVYAKTESAIFIAPICAFLLLKRITFSKRDVFISNLRFFSVSKFLIFVLILSVPLFFYLNDAETTMHGNFGPINYFNFLVGERVGVGLATIFPPPLLDLDHFHSMFPGLVWGSPLTDRSKSVPDYLRALLFNHGVNSAGEPVFVRGEETISGSFFETPQMYFLYVISLYYFSYRNFRRYPIFVCYILYGFFLVFGFFSAVAFHHFAAVFYMGFLATGWMFYATAKKLSGGGIKTTAFFAVLCFVLFSSFLYTANTIFNFDYYSGANFYGDALFKSYPQFGTFAVGKYIREHTTAANTYYADTGHLSEVVVNRNAWVGAEPYSYTVLPSKDFYIYNFRETENLKGKNITPTLDGTPPSAEFFYKGLRYIDVYNLASEKKYLDEGVCIEASEYGADYKNWGFSFSNPAGFF